MCRCSFGCINHKKQFKQILNRWESGLHDENGGSSDAFVERRLELTVTESQYIRCAKLDIHSLGYLQCEILGGSAREKLDFVFVMHYI